MKKLISLKYIMIPVVVIVATSFFLIFNSHRVSSNETSNSVDTSFIEEGPQDRQEYIEIVSGSTYGKLMSDISIANEIATAIYDASVDQYDLAQIKVGHDIELTYDKNTDDLKQLTYKINSEDELIVKQGTEDENKIWIAEVSSIDYEVRTVIKSATVSSSVYQAALDNNIDERAIIELANAFQWSIDFAMDTRVDDTFKFIYEERYLDGEYVMPGEIYAGKYVNAGEIYEVYYFEENEENKGYFDIDGNSVQKMFLKAPVSFKYISSGFTTGLRYVEAFDVSTGHRAIDYAAAYGTPIRSVGDGTVSSAGWGGAYGNLIKIRHNGTYSTNYAHLSRFAVNTGQKVKQGDIIGYVGSTGFSTGPHLHYEMVKNGIKINPLREVLPPGEPIKEENKDRFFEEIKKWQDQLN